VSDQLFLAPKNLLFLAKTEGRVGCL